MQAGGTCVILGQVKPLGGFSQPDNRADDSIALKFQADRGNLDPRVTAEKKASQESYLVWSGFTEREGTRWFCFVETGSCLMTQDRLDLIILLPQLPPPLVYYRYVLHWPA